MKKLAGLVLLAGTLFADGVNTGYRVTGLRFQGPGEFRRSVDPAWVNEYPLLRLRYRASGIPADDTPVLTLRPGSVGPVTPGGTNRENPFAEGLPVVVLRARDLAGQDQVEVDLRGKMKTPQIDQWQFTLPAGATLAVRELEFRAAQEMDCGGAAALPAGVVTARISGPLACGRAAATSLRGREAIRIAVRGRRAAALYLSLFPVLAGGLRETSEAGYAIARIRYRDHVEEQFPLLVAERRHALLNRQAGLYALELDPQRTIESVELLDRSPHLLLALSAAGFSDQPPPEADEELPPAAGAARSGPPGYSQAPWFRAPKTLRAAYRAEPDGLRHKLSLSLTNTSAAPVEADVAFPALEIRPADDPQDVYYLFPRQGAVISRRGGAWQNEYSGAFPLQFLDVFAPRAGRGAVLVIQDPDGAAKTFRLEKKGAAVEVEVRYRVRLAPGETWRAPEALLEEHGGDWHAGFAAYRQWLAAWAQPAGLHPALQTAFWCRRDYPVGGSDLLFDVRANRYTFPALLQDAAAIGGADFVDISGWALSETAGRVGDYPIELGGAADLRANIEAARARGIPTGLYFEGFLIDKNSEVGRKHGAAWQMIDAKGEPRWWPGGSPELFVCPHVAAWREYLASRIAAVATATGASAFYIDQHGFADPSKRCYAANHGHPPGISPLPGEIAMAREVRRALDAAGHRDAILYLEEAPPDTLAPYYGAAFSYNLARADRRRSPLKLSLFRFAFPGLRLWDMLSIGVQPRVLSLEDFRLSLWHGNGAWLKGRLDTWYGDEVRAFLKRARRQLGENAAAFGGLAEPLVESPDPAVFVNRFHGGRQTVFTLFNASFRTRRFQFLGRPMTLGPREVEVVRSP
jgi:hypothetical protein